MVDRKSKILYIKRGIDARIEHCTLVIFMNIESSLTGKGNRTDSQELVISPASKFNTSDCKAKAIKSKCFLKPNSLQRALQS